MTDHDKTLRDEFESDMRAHGWVDEGYFHRWPVDGNQFEGQYSGGVIRVAFDIWKMTRAKYAPLWLPIDDAAKDGWTKFILSESLASHVAYWDGREWIDHKSNRPIDDQATHYMPIPDAPEVG